jgi:hypothetical protein
MTIVNDDSGVVNKLEDSLTVDSRDDASTINMGNSHVTIVNDPSSGVKSDAPNCSVTYDRHYDDRNSFIIQANSHVYSTSH